MHIWHALTEGQLIAHVDVIRLQDTTVAPVSTRFATELQTDVVGLSQNVPEAFACGLTELGLAGAPRPVRLRRIKSVAIIQGEPDIAVDATQASGMRVMGATAHRVDQTMDGGSILAQVWSATPDTMQMIQRVSFAQKLYLMLWANQARFGDAAGSIPPQGDAVAASWAQPCLQHAALQAAFLDFVKSEEIPWPR